MSTRAAVLVIDDEPGIRDMLAYELSMEGFDVETAESGMAAVEAVKRRKFDLAVGQLSPLLNNCQAALWRLADNFARFASSRVKGQRKFLNLMRVRYLVCQITRTNKHVRTPALAGDLVTSDHWNEITVRKNSLKGRGIP